MHPALARVRRVRGLGPSAKSAYYTRRALNQTLVVGLIACVMFLVEGIFVEAASFDPFEARGNKKMNFPSVLRGENSSAIFTALNYFSSVRDFETGDTLDDTNKFYDERRWTFSWGVDMILRFEKGYDFCTSYVLVPAENTWPTAVRGMLYMTCLFYVFLGVAIVSDIFMASIEQITAEKEKVVIQEDGDGKENVIMYTMWNETVANLTLLALGSSAPEILLSVMETIQNLDKMPGELGPGTIVGSASFNLLCITAICMWAVEEVKRVKEFGVFLITAFASIFAYVWMLIVLQFNTPDVIDVWEAFVTLAMFPLLVLFAWLQDRNWFRPVPEEEDAPPQGGKPQGSDEEAQDNPEVPARRMSRRNTKIIDAKFVECSEEEVRNIINSAKARHGSVTEEYIKEEIDKLLPHKKLNVNHYRMSTIRGMLHKSGVVKRIVDQKATSNKTAPTPLERSRLNVPETGIAEFISPSYSVLEGEGHVDLRVRRHHGSSGALALRYKTSDLTAVAGEHYVKSEGTILFEDGDAEDKIVPIVIIDNKERNADRHFTCRLEADQPSSSSVVGEVSIALVTIIDDDLPGVVRFQSASQSVSETCGTAKIDVIRENGGTGTILVRYRTHDGVGKCSAVAGRDYTSQVGELTFNTGDVHKVIEIPIVDKSQYDRADHFFVYLTAAEGKVGGKLGHLTNTKVTIAPDKMIANIVQEVLNKAKEDRDNNSSVTWGDQFREAMNIGGGEEAPSDFDFVMHFLTFMWKVLFALIPPPEWAGGWLCFVISLLMIGLVTAMVAEIAGLLGCVMGLKDSVTAITFVALGTSLPDTFASKQAAEQEDTVDACIGNVTGSNSVNVFLGLGLPWVIATLYYESKGECFIVPSGTLGFSVMVFTCCAVLCLVTLMILRVKQGGEIGGKRRKPVAMFLGSLWVVYIVVSALQAYGHIPNFPGSENRCPCACSNRGVLSWAREPASVQGSCAAAGCPLPPSL